MPVPKASLKAGGASRKLRASLASPTSKVAYIIYHANIRRNVSLSTFCLLELSPKEVQPVPYS